MKSEIFFPLCSSTWSKNGAVDLVQPIIFPGSPPMEMLHLAADWSDPDPGPDSRAVLVSLFSAPQSVRRLALRGRMAHPVYINPREQWFGNLPVPSKRLDGRLYRAVLRLMCTVHAEMNCFELLGHHGPMHLHSPHLCTHAPRATSASWCSLQPPSTEVRAGPNQGLLCKTKEFTHSVNQHPHLTQQL
ncbi:uncharacterized protein [Elaeis guineensis]|uniref:uncharacterized protein n=1 Tax=Elaeis guineensis var. tenera TaxID=51953 RepID=UPI003C6DA85A